MCVGVHGCVNLSARMHVRVCVSVVMHLCLCVSKSVYAVHCHIYCIMYRCVCLCVSRSVYVYSAVFLPPLPIVHFIINLFCCELMFLIA